MLAKEFIEHVRNLKGYLEKIKEEFNLQEKTLLDQEKEDFLYKNYQEIFKNLDSYFDSLDIDFKVSDKESFKEAKEYYIKELHPFLAEGIDTNTYIREKPLGYAGDYVTMNFIYDFNDKNFFGRDIYSKLINFYTCSIDVANSNISRKSFLKEEIQRVLSVKRRPVFLSVGCGPARELIELLQEKKIKKEATFHLLDLEKNALKYVENQIALIDFDRDKIKIHYYLFDLLEIIKNKKITELFQDVDFIYVSGVFDYLSDRVCKKVVHNLVAIAKGEIIFFNMSLENARHRSYYEVFGEWVMYHRNKKEVLAWTEGLVGANSSIVDYAKCKSYWILRVEKE